MGIAIRPALIEDLPAATRVWLAAEGEDPGFVEHVPSVLHHLLESGDVLVAERTGDIVGFGTSFRRSGITFLGQMFVLPDVQSRGVGRALLDGVLPDDGTVRATIASPDPRALALYVRHGMQPLWPMYDLRVLAADIKLPSRPPVDVVPAGPGDAEVVRADASIGGRERPEDHHYWTEHRGGIPLWFERSGTRVGYGYLQVLKNGSDAELDDGTVRIGPLGAFDAADMLDCLLVAITQAREHGTHLSVLTPGPHPALRSLLDLGYRINEVETFLTSSDPPFVDPRCYIPSGGGLF